MALILYFGMVALSILILLLIWSFVCNQRACDQRKIKVQHLQDLVDDPDCSLRDLYDANIEFSDRTYKHHVLRLMTFRDPFTLYPKSMLLLSIFKRNS